MSASPSRIAELAATVAQHTKKIDDYLTARNLPQPSFEADGPANVGLLPNIEASRIAVLQASQELNDLLQGPRDLLFNHYHNNLVYLKQISKFDLAHKVPVDGEITFTNLAAKAGVDQGVLERVLRFGIANRIFMEPRPGVIAHSAASKQIADDRFVASWVGATVDEMWPAALKVIDAFRKWPNASEPNQTPFYTVLEENPDRARRFREAMSFFTIGDGYSLRHLTNGYPWNKVRGTVVDIGGSHGEAAFALARCYPHLHLIVQDLFDVVSNSKERWSFNVKLMVHDFFQEQPMKEADVYLYRSILHNWPDEYCIKILRALVPALKKGAKVLVMDVVMPLYGVVPNNLEQKLRAMDVTMLEIGNAKERCLEEWKGLFEEADSRFVFKGMKQPPGSSLAILEMSWEE